MGQSTEQLKFSLFEREMIDPFKGHDLSEAELYIAALLLKASAAQPLRIADLINALDDYFRGRLGAWSDRRVKDAIRTLRRDHAFPILARRAHPPGLWWCTSVKEMQEFIKDFRSQALDELTTLSKIVKHNYPALAGQLELGEVRQ